MKFRVLSLLLVAGLSEALVAQDGGQLYSLYCAACHADDGKGATGGVFPPLAESEWVAGKPDRAIQIVLHGMQGPVEVAGKTYNLVMPPQGEVLSDENLAAILTFVRTSWGNRGEVVQPDQVASVRAASADRGDPWTAEELVELYPLPEIDPALSRLTSRLYHGEWQNLPDFDAHEPVSQSEHANGLVSLAHVDRNDQFGLVWEGEFRAEKSADYTFRLGADDGARVVLAGELLLEVDGIGPMSPGRTKEARVHLEEGSHPIRIEYFEFEGQEDIALSWKLHDDDDDGGGWKYLSESRGGPPAPDHPSIPINPSPDRAAIYRNFIAGTTPRAIGIGFPGGVNVAYSADHLAPELAWTGRFMDGGRHWTGRGQGNEPPAGERVVKLTAVPAFPDGARFRGYVLDAAGNPTFKVTHGNLLIDDAYQASDGRLIRKLSARGHGGPLAIAIAGEESAGLTDNAATGQGSRARLEISNALRLDVAAPSLKRDRGHYVVTLSGGESATLVYQWLGAE